MPSFVIRGAASRSAFNAWSLPSLRLDRVNSRELLRAARLVYFEYLACGAGTADPLGVVMQQGSGQGRVVFERPVLLPEEQFVPLELVRIRGGSRVRTGRPQGPRVTG